MVQDSYNIIPVTLAILLHGIVFGSLFVAFDLSREAAPPMPLMMTARLVTEDTVEPPPVRQPEPEPEPEPEAEVQQPDTEELARDRAEEQKRRDDALREQQRLDDIRRKEAERKAAENKARRERDAEEHRRELEAQRLADIEQQRQDNLLEQQRLEREAREAMIAAEDADLELQNSTEMQVYQNLLRQRVMRNWARPGTARDDLECVVRVEQVLGGTVASTRILRCNGDEIIQRSVEAAVKRASPLPMPENPALFTRSFTITFRMNE